MSAVPIPRDLEERCAAAVYDDLRKTPANVDPTHFTISPIIRSVIRATLKNVPITDTMVERAAMALYNELDGLRGRMHCSDADAMAEARLMAEVILKAALNEEAQA